MPARLRSPFLTAETARFYSAPESASIIVQLPKEIRFQTKIESTIRYLGIEVDDALAIAEQVDVWRRSDAGADPVADRGGLPRAAARWPKPHRHVAAE